LARLFLFAASFAFIPPYAAAVLLFALVVPWTRINLTLSGAVQLVSHLALVHNLYSNTYFGLSPAFWSIAVEVQLYFLYPVLLALVSRFGWKRSLIYIGALEITLRGICGVLLVSKGTVPLWLTGVPFVYWFSWSIGAALADAYISRRSLPFANQSLLLWLGIAVASTFAKPTAFFSFLCFSLLTAAAIAKLLHLERTRTPFPAFLSKYLQRIGLWSYSIYLLHQPFLMFLHVSTYPLLGFLICLGVWFPIEAFSGLWFKFFELPSIALGKRLLKTISERAMARAIALRDESGPDIQQEVV
jgi:peptidoglycan/LPS O-acetylase OafA/YrhL